jgi:CcmD family protein
MNKLRKIIATIIAAIYTLSVQAQTATEPVDMMRSNGKIYVVVAVVIVILLGLFLYVFSLDRKISKMERK